MTNRRSTGAAIIALVLLLSAACRVDDPVATSGGLRLLIEEAGIYRLSLAEMRGAGLTVNRLAAQDLALSREGEPVPYLLDEDSLIFYGQPPQSRYTRTQAYLLRAGQPGLSMAERQAAPHGPTQESVERMLHFEENWEYTPEARQDGLGDPWFWQTVPLQGKLIINIPVPNPASGAGALQLNLYGASHNPAEDPDHTLGVALDGGSQPYAVSWDGRTAYTATVPVAAGTLRDGENTLVVEDQPQDFIDVAKLDRVELRYDALPTAVADQLTFAGEDGQVRLDGFSGTPLLFDVTDPRAPAVLIDWEQSSDGAVLGLESGARIVATGPHGFLKPITMTPLRDAGWGSPQHGADLVIITTAELSPALGPLVEAREEQGLRVAVALTEDIYDEFGAGMATPDSINAFLSYAYANWQEPRLRYVLLVGDATSDFRADLASRPQRSVQPPRNVIPPYLVPVDYSGETVSDARLVDVDGDMRPDMAVGRWPVDSVDSVRSLVRRTLAYESSRAPNRALFASDGSSAEFSSFTERVVAAAGLPAGGVQFLNGPRSDEMTAAWNQGAWLVAYAGHGSLNLWGKDNIFSSEAIPSLASAPVAPIVLQLTCLTGLFAHPEIVSLSERLIAQEGGPVLTVAASSLTLSSHQEPFATAFLQALQDPTVARIGDAFQHAKLNLDISNDGLREISDTFGLIGDPSTLIVRP